MNPRRAAGVAARKYEACDGIAIAQPGVAKRMLILEDDACLAKHLRRLFSSRGYDVSATATTASFIAAASRASFDVVLFDLSLPDGSGIDAWAAVRTRQEAAHAILMTAYGSDAALAAAARLGVARVLSKPVDLAVLLAAVAAD